jgi:hypothetical protein
MMPTKETFQAISEQMADLAPYQQTPFAGLKGQGTGLSIRRQNRLTTCQTDPRTMLFIALGLFMFGPMILLMLLFSEDVRRQASEIPWFIGLPVMALLVLADWGMAMMLLKRRRFVVDQNRREIRFFEGGLWPRATPAFTLPMVEIRGLEGATVEYRNSDGYTIPNYALYLQTAHIERFCLCISNKQAEVDEMAAILRETFGLPATPTDYTLVEADEWNHSVNEKLKRKNPS